MRVLHLYGDYKWTGPAEPVLNLCLKLRQMGQDVRFACCAPPSPAPRSLEGKARERGIEPITGFALDPSLDLVKLAEGIRQVADYIRRARIEILHVHQGRDHLVGGLAARRSHTPVRIVRTNHRADPMAQSLGSRLLLRQYTDALLEVSRGASETDRLASGLGQELVGDIDGAVDLERFNPKRTFPDVRARFGIGREDIVVGMVARLQRHRKFDLFLEAMKIAAGDMPEIRALVLGRGTHMNEVGVEPARDMGLGDTVIFAGYVEEGYEAAVAAFDMKVYLVPGSDGSCRAVLEAMAMGKPVIAAKRGALPEIIEHEQTGILVNDDPKEIADWILRLAGHPALRDQIGLAARTEAEKRFTVQAQAEAVSRIYENVLKRRKG